MMLRQLPGITNRMPTRHDARISCHLLLLTSRSAKNAKEVNMMADKDKDKKDKDKKDSKKGKK